MATISQEVNIEMLEKLADGTFKIKYPKTKADLVIGLTEAINSAKVISVFSGKTTKSGSGVYDNIVIPLGKVPTKYIKLLGTGSYDSYGHCFIDLANNMFYGFEKYFSSDKVRSNEIVAELGTFSSLGKMFNILGATYYTNSPGLVGVTVSGSDLILRYRHNTDGVYATINNLIVEVV